VKFCIEIKIYISIINNTNEYGIDNNSGGLIVNLETNTDMGVRRIANNMSGVFLPLLLFN